jgi:hypothetical protein
MEKRPHEPVQATKLSSEASVVVRESNPILPHWKDYRKDDIHYKTFEGSCKCISVAICKLLDLKFI